MKKMGIKAATLMLLLGAGALSARTLPTTLTPSGPQLPADAPVQAVVPVAPNNYRANQSPAVSFTNIASTATEMRERMMQSDRLGEFVFTTPENVNPAKRLNLAGGKRLATTTSDLAGSYVMTYKSLVTTVGDGGLAVNVTALGTDSIIIHNFWAETIDVHAAVNTTTGEITIPAQYIYTHTTYGAMWLAMCSSTGAPVYDTPLTGTINADGTLSIDSWWGVFIKSGSDAGKFLCVAYMTEFQRTNGTMTSDLYPSGSETYGVVISQPVENAVQVVNLGNFGMTVSIDLNRYSSGQINTQPIRAYPANSADFMSISVGGYTTSETGAVQLQSPLTYTIYLDTIPGAKTTRTLTWGCWSALSSGTNNYFLKPWLNGKITANFDIKYPMLEITEFAGSGTEADPYQIKTRNDLILLSQKVEDCTDANPNLPANYYPQYRAFLGKYFKVMNDIDMSNYKFTPIGNDSYHRFAGTFDGNGHKISNLYVQREEAYAGLFGMCDTTAVLKNVTMVNPDVTNTNNYAASLVAWTYGSVDNCHVQGGSVICNGQVEAALVGSVAKISNCTATGSQVAGAGGWTGGVAGQVTASMVNCSATDVTVKGYPGSGTALGGVAGLILGTAENLYFKGTVDGYSLGVPSSSGVQTGTIAGIVQNGTMKNCFGVGTVLSRGTYAKIGGLIGRAQGVSVENCYFRGRIGSYYSRYTGGLVGNVMNLTNNGQPVSNSFKNLYVAAYEDLEDYQYDTTTGWAETLGVVDDTSTLTTSNIYYDRQLFTENSENGTGLTTAQLTSAAGPQGFDANYWQFTAGRYPVLKSFASTSASNLAASAVLFVNDGQSVGNITKVTPLTPVGETQFMFLVNGKGYQQGHCAKIENNTIVPQDFGVDTLFTVNGTTNFYYIVKVAPVPFDGAGTEANPYQIKTKDDLIALSQYTTERSVYFPDTYFKQMNDIDMENDTTFLGLCTMPTDAHCRFAGTYDGGGFTITNMHIRGLIWKIAPTATTLGTPNTTTGSNSFGYQGFIGRLDVTGALKNINFRSCARDSVWASVGVAVGDNYGLIENVRNYSDITAISCWVGGICGMNELGGSIINCYNEGNVTSGYNCAGGVCGRNNGYMENCANAGTVTVKKIANFGSNYNVAGGITTNVTGARMVNCLNVGSVYTQGPVAGGIVASLTSSVSTSYPWHNEVESTLSLGSVMGSDLATIGIVAGLSANMNKTTGSVKYNYYDDQIANVGAFANEPFAGMIALSTSELTSGTALEGLSTEYWQFDAGMYPTLKSFVNEPKLQAARQIQLKLPAGVTVRDLTANGTLSSNATWNLNPATFFTISGNTLNCGGTPESLQEAELTGTYNGFSRLLYLKKVPPVPMQGSGTQADPYIIPSTTVWNNVADYISAVNDKFEGKYIKITADLNFTSGFKPLFLDNAASFEGTLDGDNHSVTINGYVPANTYDAPIRTLGANGTIKNLTLKGQINAAKSYASAFIGKVYGKVINCVNELNLINTMAGGAAFGIAYSGASFENVVNKGTISSTTGFGGLCSTANAGVTFTDCANLGTIKSTQSSSSAPSSAQNIGGLVGTAYQVKMTRCYNSGNFEFVKKDYMFGVAGLIGYVNAASGNQDSTVLVNCYNTADIEVGWMAAGLIANSGGSTSINNVIHIRDCYNSGDMINTGTVSKTGGCPAGIICMPTKGTEILNCYNTGSILNLNPKAAYAAGISGYYKTAPTATDPMVIAGCYNTGTVSAAYNAAGGIIGYTPNYCTISDCYNTGDIDAATKGAGGIAGFFNTASGVIQRCWNSGNITTGNNCAGGIAGAATTKSVMIDCFNVGNVTNTATTITANATTHQATAGYGVGGVVGEGGGNMTRCYNMGAVTGICNVGGLIGRPTKNNTVVTSCYNAGAIHAPADTCGSLIGIDFTTAGRLWAEGTNKVEDSYYIPVDSLHNNTVGSPKTHEVLAGLNMGTGWIATDYTYPVLSALNTDLARVWAAQVVLKDIDVPSGIITGSFHVGMPEGVSWTSSIANLHLDTNKFIWSGDAYAGPFTLTAACGPYTRVWNLQADKTVGVEGIDADAEVIYEGWYTVGGIRVPAPASADGQIYIVVRRYSDGTERTFRLRN